MVKRITSGAVTEYCSECETEVEFRWRTETDGYKAFCPHCGSRLMLCNLCPRADTCGYDRDTDTCPMMFDGCLNRKQFIDYLDATFDIDTQTMQMVKNVLDIIQDDALTVDKKRSILKHMVHNIIHLADREIRMLNLECSSKIAEDTDSEYCQRSRTCYDEYIHKNNIEKE